MGKNLVQDLSFFSGLEEKVFNKKFDELLKKHGSSSAQLSLGELREILAQEIQDVFLELKRTAEEFPEKSPQPLKVKSN